MQWHLRTQWSPESDPPSLPVALPEEARRDLSRWMVKDQLLTGVRFGAPAPDLHLYSDAFSSGWGAHLLDQNVSGVWSDQEKLLHINLLKMKALFLGLQAFQDVAGHHVTAMCDNSTVVAYVNKRGHGFQVPVFVDQPPSEIDGEFRRPSRCEVSARRVQRAGRCAQPLRASCGDRVVSPPSGGEVTALRLGQSVDRPFCDVPQREAVPVLLACPGSPGRLRGCVSSSLGPPGSVRVPSLCSGRSGDRPRPAVVECRDDSGRASLAREGVVRRLAASTDSTTPGSALLGQAASATPLQSVSSRRPRAEASCVETLKRHYQKSGFSGRAARVLSGVLRESSSRLYQSRWKIFCDCVGRGRGVAPVNATVPVVVDFLIHFRQDKGLSVSAVKGYCSALNSVLALKGRDLASFREITMLLRSFSRSVNTVELRPPAWDVSLVLQSLTGAPYGPLRTCEEHFLAQKKLFLLALASAKRIGELHALSYRVSHTRNWGEVSFSFVTGFVAKTRDPSSLAPRFEGFSVPALPNARNNRNGRLCPVRAVRCYLDCTAPHRPRCERFFVTAGRSKKEIAKTTVSFWLRKTISRAYELSGTAFPVPAPRARETRGILLHLFFSRRILLSTRC